MTRRGSMLTASALALCFSGAWALADSPERFAEAFEQAKVALDVKKEVTCIEPAKGPPAKISHCAKLYKSERRDLDRITGAFDEILGERCDLSAPWAVGDRTARKRYVCGALPLDLSYDIRSGVFRILYPGEFAPCLSRELPDAERLDKQGGSVPQRVEHVSPLYPGSLQRQGISGVVQLQAEIRADGSVGETCVQYERPAGRGFARSALDAVASWSYTPATRGGAPLAVSMTITIDFEAF